jgi:hypothetical protein
MVLSIDSRCASEVENIVERIHLRRSLTATIKPRKISEISKQFALTIFHLHGLIRDEQIVALRRIQAELPDNVFNER